MTADPSSSETQVPPSGNGAGGDLSAALAASYWGNVWRRLIKRRMVRIGTASILFLFLIAVAAPLITLNQPFYWNSGEGPEFPWFGALLNRLLFENSVDIFFNVILIGVPIHLSFWAWTRTVRSQVRRRRLVTRWLRAAVVLHFGILLVLGPRTLFGVPNPAYVTRPVINYTEQQRELEQANQPVTAVFPLRKYGYRETDPARSVEPPSAEHWFGTDPEGRDVFARMIYGTRISLTIGVVAVGIYMAIGVLLGALAGYLGGWVDVVISRLIEVIICFPSFFLILTLAALIEERSIFHVMIIIGITSWTGVARLVRAEFLRQKNLDYAQAAVALGLRQPRIIFRHLLPNSIAPVLVTATFGVASAILIESSLSFLGVGDLTVPSWGATLNAGRLEQKLWLILCPGIAIFFVVSMFNLVGEGLRDALDPKLRS